MQWVWLTPGDQIPVALSIEIKERDNLKSSFTVLLKCYTLSVADS